MAEPGARPNFDSAFDVGFDGATNGAESPAAVPAGAETPDDSAAVSVGPPPRAAGGLGALTATLDHLRHGPGLLRGARATLAMNQPHGFDCPGCAWPEPARDRSMFEFCENGAKAVAWETDTRRVDAAFFAQPEHSIAALAEKSDHWLGQQGRLTEPMVRRPGASHYTPCSWDQAFDLIAGTLAELGDPNRAAFYTSGRTSNETAFLLQLFARQLGTNNLPDCSNLCHESSGYALKQAIGVGKGTVQLSDFEEAELILLIGQNPGTNHPRMMTTLQAAARRGCRIVSINPLAEVALTRFRHPQQPLEALGRGTPIASLHLPVRVGGDVALLKGVMKELLELEDRRPGEVLDHDFIATYTRGFPELAESIRGQHFPTLVEESGIARERMREVAELVASSTKIIACWAMGLTQHEHAIANIQEVANLLLLRGAVGRPGAGLCPVRGHSNVQGDRTMGITSKPDAALLDALAKRYDFSPPREPGLDVAATIEAMRAGKVRLFFGMGGNFLSASPDTAATAAALGGCLLTAQVSTKLNRAHVVTGQQALILPCLGRTERDVQAGGEQFVTVEDSMGTVHRSQGVLDPGSTEQRSEPAIVAELAAKVLPARSRVPWKALAGDYDRIRDEIAAVLPAFADFNRRVRADAGFVLDNPARSRRFNTKSGKAELTVHALPRKHLGPGQLLLTTVRSHDQYNTTIYGLDDRYRGVRGGRHVVFLNGDDITALELAPGMLVDLTSRHQGQIRTAARFLVVPYDIPRGSAAAYFPEANVLVPLPQRAKESGTPASKSVVITVAPTAPA